VSKDLGKKDDDKTNARLATLAAGTDHSDGDNLYLSVRPSGSRSWVLKFTWREPGEAKGSPKKVGGGSYPAVGLTAARKWAAEQMEGLARNPSVMPKALGYVDPALKLANMTLGEYARTYLDEIRLPGIKSKKCRDQWEATYTLIAKLHGKRLRDVVVDDIRKALAGKWLASPVMAGVHRMQLHAIFKTAASQGYCDRDKNPANEDTFVELMPAQTHSPKGRKALPYAEMHDFWAELVGRVNTARGANVIGWAAQAMVLTATRCGEVRQMQWTQIDRKRRRWVIPDKVMGKNGHEADIPLSVAMLALLDRVEKWQNENRIQSPYVFPGSGADGMIGDGALLVLIKIRLGYDATAHGFRSTFKTWCQQETLHQDEATEMCLHHIKDDATREAYARGDMWDKRRDALEHWALYVQGLPMPSQFMKPTMSQVGWDQWNVVAG
jgi:integrase